MKISILDVNKLIEVNSLKEVTSPSLFSSKMVFDPNGILSNDIFGISKADRRNTYAYISLSMPFLHPHIYNKVLKPLKRDIVYLVAGQKRFSVKNGELVEDPDGWTGLKGLYENWEKIEWSKSKSSNDINKNLLQRLPKNQIFIDKLIVCPPAYRDVLLAGSVDKSDHINVLNDLYTKMIRYVASIKSGGIFSRTQYATQLKIQDLIVEISNYFKDMIARKTGLIRKYLIGKTVDYGARAVISMPTYNHERIEDNIIDIRHSAIPIAMCCSTFYPFIEAWLKSFFTREILNNPNVCSFYDETEHREITATMKDVENQFSDRKIRKMINDYMLNPDSRFKVIKITVEIPKRNNIVTEKEVILQMKGKKIMSNSIPQELVRPMTVTDLLYLAAVDSCEKRHTMISRYPLGTDKGIYFSKIRVQSTAKHIKLVFNGKEYPFYPDIDLNIPTDHVGVQFIDTLVLSNSHLDGMGADYDGDTLSVRGIWTDEANLEAEKIMNKKMSALMVTGGNSKVVAKEVFNSFYSLTKNGNIPAKPVTPEDTQSYLTMKPDDITRTFLCDTFADVVNTTKGNNTNSHTRYNTWDTIKVPANHFYEGQEACTMTVGRYIVNKFVLQASGTIAATKLKNSVWDKGYLSDIDTEIGHLYMEDIINRDQYDSYLDHRDTLGYWANGMLAHTISPKMVKPLPEIEKKKAELIKKYEKELANHDIDVMTKITNELVAYAKELLKDDPGMDLYLSGDLDFKNNYRNNSVIKGSVLNKLTDEYDFIDTSYMDGINIKDIPSSANSILASQYPASIATSESGYMGKKLLALMQMMSIDYNNQDCGTKNTIPLIVTKYNKKFLDQTVFIENGAEKVLTPSMVDSYIGKTINMRSPMSCTSEKLCAKCASNLFKMLDVENVGLFVTQISHAALNLGLKAKHDATIDLYTIDPSTVIQDI